MTRTTPIPRIGELLRLSRVVYPGGKSREETAEQTGIGYWRPRDLERGHGRPHPDELEKLAAVLERPELAAVAQVLRQPRPARPEAGR